MEINITVGLKLSAFSSWGHPVANNAKKMIKKTKSFFPGFGELNSFFICNDKFRQKIWDSNN
jgi:hypothetical protein